MTSFVTSLDYLAHYGVAGMKWGVWNDETRRKYVGGPGRRGIDSKLSNKNLDVKTSDYIDTEKSIRADLKAANLGGKLVSSFKKYRQYNTGYCTAAYLLRRSGYDVAAKTTRDGFDVKDIAKLYKDIKTDISIKQGLGDNNKLTHEQIRKIESSLVNQGEGASGFIVGSYAQSKNNGTQNGRVLAYTVANGIVHVIDGQCGDSYSIDRGVAAFGDVKTIRTDNKTVDEKVAQKYAGSTELLKRTDNEIDKIKVALASTAAVGGALTVGSVITNAVANTSISNFERYIDFRTDKEASKEHRDVLEALEEYNKSVDKYNDTVDRYNRSKSADSSGSGVGDFFNKLFDGKNESKILETDKSDMIAKSLKVEEKRDAYRTKKESIKEEFLRQGQSKLDTMRSIARISTVSAVGGSDVCVAALLGLRVYDIVKNVKRQEKKENKQIGYSTYEKAARAYLKAHPNSTMTVSELAAKYEKEWTEGNK